MDNDFEIEILTEEDALPQNVQLPVNFLTFGEIDSGDVQVYIRQDVYKALEELAVSDTQKELGSILFGEYCEAGGRMHVIISGYVEAKYTEASASTLTFTHETWAYVHAQHQKRYAGQKIVGWQHTHPNYGVFLSNYDLFIQENFFDLPFQVAYVIDPIQNLRGFFQWKKGRVEKLKGYHICDDGNKPIKIQQTRIPSKEEPRRKPALWMPILLAVLCVAVLVLSVCTLSLNSKYQQQLAANEDLNQRLDTQNELLQTHTRTISELQKQLQTVAREPEEEPAAEDSGGVTFFSYTVVEGDSLSKICMEHGLDYEANKYILLGINGISDPDQIYVGQIILLPVTE